MRSSEKQRGTSKERWGIVDPPRIPDWEAAHIFLEVARSGSFRAAAHKLGQSVNVLRRRIDEFEGALGVPLLIRHVNGVKPTAEGVKIYAAALQMETASFDLIQAQQLSDRQVEGEVSIAITEGLGSVWLAPHLAEFQAANPRLTVNLRCGQRPPDLLRLEADISVQLERPTDSDLKVVKLGRLHMIFFAAKSYLDAYGYPSTLSDIPKHRMVVMADEQRQWEGKYLDVFPGIATAGLTLLRSNAGTAIFSAIAHGAGIGALPTYVQALGADLVPLALDFYHPIDIWLTYRPDAKRIPRIRQTIEWITEVFEPRRFPWFRNEFIHPDRFPEVYSGPPVRSSLERMLAPG